MKKSIENCPMGRCKNCGDWIYFSGFAKDCRHRWKHEYGSDIRCFPPSMDSDLAEPDGNALLVGYLCRVSDDYTFEEKK